MSVLYGERGIGLVADLQKNTLTGKMVRRMLRSILTGFFIFVLIFFGGNDLIEQSSFYGNWEWDLAEKKIQQLQDYVRQNKLKMTDSKALFTWGEQEELYELIVYNDDGRTMFDLNNVEINPDGTRVDPHSFEWFHFVTFEDGKAGVYIYDGCGQNIKLAVTGFAIVLALFLCFGTFAIDMKEDIQYVQKLEKEIEYIGNGDLDHAVTVIGKDELTSLATYLEGMRHTLKNNRETEANLRKAQKKLILGMAHDMRTPMTGLLTYLEILRRQEENGQIDRTYLDKAYGKVDEMKRLSDQMFEFFLIDAEKNAELELPEELFSAWGDYLSEICIVLGSEGFTVDVASLEWRPVKISISRDYVGRIVNNIVSNLRKYADRQYPVYMKILYGADTVEIELGNHIRKPNTYVENTGIGVTNIKMMMKQMHGKAIVEMSDSTYVIRLRFPLATEHDIESMH